MSLRREKRCSRGAPSDDRVGSPGRAVHEEFGRAEQLGKLEPQVRGGKIQDVKNPCRRIVRCRRALVRP